MILRQSFYLQKLRYSTTPTPDWGPALAKHRELVTRYVPSFIVDPDDAHFKATGKVRQRPEPTTYQVGSKSYFLILNEYARARYPNIYLMICKFFTLYGEINHSKMLIHIVILECIVLFRSLNIASSINVVY